MPIVSPIGLFVLPHCGLLFIVALPGRDFELITTLAYRSKSMYTNTRLTLISWSYNRPLSFFLRKTLKIARTQQYQVGQV